jgi:serine/threonine protein kinase
MSKKCKTIVEIEALRIQIEMYKVSVHPYVVRLLDYFEDKEYIYLCLEKYQGTTLDHYIEVNAGKL